MTSITVVLLILKALGLMSIDWWMCFIPTMADIAAAVAVLALYGVLAWNSPIRFRR